MKTKTTRTSFIRMSIPLLLMALPGMAAVMPVSYDFGSGTGQTTYQDAGFDFFGDGGLTISDGADHVSLRRTGGANNVRGGLTQTFAGLGNGATNNFSITSQYTYNVLSRGRQNVGSIILFASGQTVGELRGTTAGSSGIGIHFFKQNNTTGADDALRFSGAQSITEGDIPGTLWGPAGDSNILVQTGDVMEMSVDVSFSGADMTIDATLSRIGGTLAGRTSEELLRSVTLSQTVVAADYIDNEFFGFGGRWGNNSDTHLETFAVIPEPGTLALVGIALGSLLLFRRRR